MADMPTASPVDAEKQQKDGSWPVPGDEGFVHPDGTPQAVGQLADNRQAQADRDHIGSVVHGAPLATPGPQAGAITSAKVEAAAKLDTVDEGQTWVEKSLAETAASVGKDQAAPAAPKK
jgi:hypothetical protein